MSREQAPAFLALATAGFVSALTIRIAEPLLPVVANDFGVTPSSAVGVVTGFTLAYGAFQLVHGALGDRYGLLKTVAVMLFVAGLASFGCATADSLDTLVVFRFLCGMAGGAIVPLSFAYVGVHTHHEARQAILARFIAGILLGHTLGPLIGGMCSDWVGWRGTFWVCGIGFIAVSALLVKYAWHERRSPASVSTSALETYRCLWAVRHVRVICIVVAIEGCLFFGAFAFSGALMHEKFNLSSLKVGLAIAGFGVGGLLYSALVRVLLAKFGPVGMIGLSGIGMAVCFAIFPFIGTWWVVPVVIIALGFFYFLLHNTLQTQATEMSSQNKGSAVALFAFFFFVGQSLGALAVGYTIDQVGYIVTYLVVGVGLGALAGWFVGYYRTL